METSENSIPKNWVSITLNDIRKGKNPTILPKKFPDTYFELYSVPSLKNNKPEIIQGNEIGSNKQLVHFEDVLLCKINPRINRVWVVGDFSDYQKIASTEWIPFNRIQEIYPKYLAYYLKQYDFVSYLTTTASGVGGSLMRSNASKVGKYPFLLSPYNEQIRIVSKIEELYSRLDQGVKALKQTQIQLEQYRLSLLHQAFTGELTQRWRKSTYKVDSEKKKDIENLPLIPQSWKWENVKDVGDIVTGSTPKTSIKEYYGDEHPFYKPTDLNQGFYVNDASNKLSNLGLEQARVLPEKSILVTCIGATIGKTGLIRKKGTSNQQINSIIPKENMVPEYIYFICISPDFQKSIIINASQTTLPILNKTKFSNLDFPVPPYKEQKIISKKLEQIFSMTEKNKEEINLSLSKCILLKQLILKQAFSGDLVPQDPMDAPASVLLERIGAEKAKLKPTRRRTLQRKSQSDFIFTLTPVKRLSKRIKRVD